MEPNCQCQGQRWDTLPTDDPVDVDSVYKFKDKRNLELELGLKLVGDSMQNDIEVLIFCLLLAHPCLEASHTVFYYL